MGRVLGANKKSKAESADRESPNRSVVASPMADEPDKGEGDEPDATDPHNVVPHHRICDLQPDLSPSAAGCCEFAPVVTGRAF